jgi:hypothetical protein
MIRASGLTVFVETAGLHGTVQSATPAVPITRKEPDVAVPTKRNYEAELHRRLAEAHLTAAAASTDLWYLKKSVKRTQLNLELVGDYNRDLRTTSALMKRASFSAARLEIQLVSFLQNGEAPEFDDERADLEGTIAFIRRQRRSLRDDIDESEEPEASDEGGVG